ncbi:MAG: Bcr/CflA family multidrug efflux MFS transporter [Thalassobaculales bacterium]
MMRTGSPWLIAYLAALVALGQLSIGVYVPSMPSLVGTFHTDAATVKLTLTVFLAGIAVSQLAHGPLSDRFGRRPVLLGGLALFATASAGCALAPSVEWLIVGRFLQAVGACSGQVVARAIARDLFEGAQMARVMALVGLVLSLGPAIAPVLGGVVHGLAGWAANFLILASVGVVMLWVTLQAMRETNHHRNLMAIHLPTMLANYAMLAGHRVFLGYTLVLGFIFGTMFAYVAGSPFIMIGRLGLSPAVYGALSLLNVAGYALGTVLARRLAARHPPRLVVAAGTAIAFAGGLGMLAFPLAGIISVPAMIAPMMVFLTGMGLVIPSCMAGGMQPFPRLAGSASALMGFGQMGLGMAGTLLVGWLDGFRPHAMFEAFFLMSLAAVLAYLGLLWRAPAER